MIEAVKQIYAPSGMAEPDRVKRKAPVYAPLSDGHPRRTAVDAPISGEKPPAGR
jgi:hypothetical protein